MIPLLLLGGEGVTVVVVVVTEALMHLIDTSRLDR